MLPRYFWKVEEAQPYMTVRKLDIGIVLLPLKILFKQVFSSSMGAYCRAVLLFTSFRVTSFLRLSE